MCWAFESDDISDCQGWLRLSKLSSGNFGWFLVHKMAAESVTRDRHQLSTHQPQSHRKKKEGPTVANKLKVGVNNHRNNNNILIIMGQKWGRNGSFRGYFWRFRHWVKQLPRVKRWNTSFRCTRRGVPTLGFYTLLHNYYAIILNLVSWL